MVPSVEFLNRKRKENEGDFIYVPDFHYDASEYQKINRDGEGAALIILRNPEKPEILLGFHNSRDVAKHGRWGFFGETRKSGEETGLETLSRGISEELNLDIENLTAFAFSQAQTFHMVKDLPRRTQYYTGTKSFMVGMYVVWTKDDLSGDIGSSEISMTRYWPLNEILKSSLEIPLREFTLTSLDELNDFGLLSPAVAPLKPVHFPI